MNLHNTNLPTKKPFFHVLLKHVKQPWYQYPQLVIAMKVVIKWLNILFILGTVSSNFLHMCYFSFILRVKIIQSQDKKLIQIFCRYLQD